MVVGLTDFGWHLIDGGGHVPTTHLRCQDAAACRLVACGLADGRVWAGGRACVGLWTGARGPVDKCAICAASAHRFYRAKSSSAQPLVLRERVQGPGICTASVQRLCCCFCQGLDGELCRLPPICPGSCQQPELGALRACLLAALATVVEQSKERQGEREQRRWGFVDKSNDRKFSWAHRSELVQIGGQVLVTEKFSGDPCES